MEKIRYELDPYNRLVIDRGCRRSGLPKLRKVIDGIFKVDEHNNLSYHVKAPFAQNENIPHQINLKGQWSLTDNHDLRLTLDKSGRETFGDEITLRGEILNTREDSLLFAVSTKTKEGTKTTYVLNLKGMWKADRNNRLSFHIRKEDGLYDILTFNGAWEINKSHHIVYKYEKIDLIRKKKKIHALTFKGYWDIRDRFRISYVLSKDTDSVFYFTVGAGTFKEDYIKYEVGMGLTARSKPLKRTVALFGRWKIKKDTGLIFEIEYENKKVAAIFFGADAKLTDRDTISFGLKDYIERKEIGANLELSHKILKPDGEAFLHLLKSKGEIEIYAGSGWRW